MNDSQLRQNILDELEFAPSIEPAHIGVAVEQGVVTLTGHVRTFAEKMDVEDCVKRIKGVKALAENLEVRYPSTLQTSDDEIAQHAVNITEWRADVPSEVQIKVEKGRVILNGTMDWDYQRQAIEEGIRRLTGVKGVTNLIKLRPKAVALDVKKRIEDALNRNAELEANSIRIFVDGNKVTLKGSVRAWHERALVEKAAWSAPGVDAVEDLLTVA